MNNLKYHFRWGSLLGRDIEKFVLWLMGKAYFDRFGHIKTIALDGKE
jgi:hypothetical protein